MRQYFLIALLLLTIPLIPLAAAEDYTVGVKPAPPFIIVGEDGSVSGFSIDLLEQLLVDIDPQYVITYHVDPDMPTHLQSIIDGNVDLGIAATTITSEREQLLDFSHPFFESSIGMIVNEAEKRGIVQILMQKEAFYILLGLFLYLFLAGFIIWLIELGEGEFDNRFFPGVFQGMWWVIVTMSTVGYGDKVPKKGAGKVFASIVIISGIVIFGILIAQLSSILTIDELQPTVESPADLIGQEVAVIEGTQTVTLVEEMGMLTVKVKSIDQGIELLRKGRVLAFIHDTPLLKYYMLHHDLPGMVLLDDTFSPSYYGIVFPEGSPLRETFNRALISMQEDGSYDALVRSWFN